MPERNTMKKIQELQQVKGDAYDYYIDGNEDTDLFEKIFLVEEIKASNDIEGVHSSRREIQEAIDTNVTEVKRFSSIVSKYRDILNTSGKKEFYINEDIRALYDELVSNEIERIL